MKHMVALASGHGWHTRDLLRAARGLSLKLSIVPFSSVRGRVGQGPHIEAGGIDLSAVAGVLVRMMPPGSLEQVVFRMDALHRLESLAVPVVNPPRAIEAAVDKYLASSRLEAAGLPVPRTWVGESSRDAQVAFGELGEDVLVKPLFGSEGRGMVRVQDRETARRVFRAWEQICAVIYVQQFVPNEGHDLRVFVLGGRVLAAMRRTAGLGSWRANLAQGGSAERVEVDARAAELAIRSAQALGAHVAGVDLLPDRDGRLWVIEVNAVPGWRGLSHVTGVDVAAALLADLRSA